MDLIGVCDKNLLQFECIICPTLCHVPPNLLQTFSERERKCVCVCELRERERESNYSSIFMLDKNQCPKLLNNITHKLIQNICVNVEIR